MAAPLPTYYEILQVERDAPPERIRLAYRRLAQKYHPDKHAGSESASRAMAAINAAYEVLSDAQQRAAHDVWIAGAHRPPRRAVRAAPAQSFRAFIHPANSWPWALLFAVMAFALATIGAAVYLTAKPASPAAATPKSVVTPVKAQAVPRPPAPAKSA
jgi:hypothetical protein